MKGPLVLKMGISIRAYARHRGVTDTAVHKAIRAGRITPEADGTIDADRADREWARNSDAPKAGTRAKATKVAVPEGGGDGPAALPAGGASLLQARTVNEVVKAQTNKVRLARLKGELVDRPQAIAHVFKLARSERDAWLNWPARISAQMAAKLAFATSIAAARAEAAARRANLRTLEAEALARVRLADAALAQARAQGLATSALVVDAAKARLQATAATGAVTQAVASTSLLGRAAGLLRGVLSLTAGTITLKRPTLGNWPAGSWIAPARLGRLPAQQTVTRPTAAISQAKLRFELEDLASPVTAISSPIQYRGYDTLLQHPNRVEDVSIDYQRLADVFDVETGTPAVIDIPNRPLIVRRHQYLLPDRARLTAMRGWLAARAGRQVPFWVPTWERGLEVAQPFALDATEILVQGRGFATYYQAMPGRRDVAFLHNDGTWFLRSITGFEFVDGVVERMRIDAALGRACVPSDFRIVCFLELARLESDAVEFFFETDRVVRVTLPIRSING